MARTKAQYPDLPDSDLHHSLKNDPGAEGDEDHDKASEGEISEDVEAAIEQSDADTQLADKLKNAIADGD